MIRQAQRVWGEGARRPRPGLLCTFAVLALLLAPVVSPALTRTTITVDSDMSDWTPVLVDPENALADAGEFQGDPDNPGADRDLRGFAVTWDDQNLYFWWRRTLSGNNTITFSVYLDLDFDGRMSSSDVVARYRFSGGTFQSAELVAYDDGGTPDVITGDGVPMPGGFGGALTAVQQGAGSLSGIQLNGSVDWASLQAVRPALGIGDPLNLHISAGTNNNAEDNMAAFDTLFSRLDLQAPTDAAATPGSEAWLGHTVVNEGNGVDVVDLLVTATQLWDHALWSDPDGDGDPSDGERMALDSNGDGDYDDPFDIAPGPVWDADGNGVADSGPLAPGESFSFVLAVMPPATAANGELDEIELTARSANVPSTRVVNEDTVTAGTLTVRPDREARATPGTWVDHGHTACNAGGSDEVLEFATSSLLGWAVELWSDPDGDGDPSDGALLTDTDGDTLADLLVAAGACRGLVARHQVDPAALVGDQDVLEIVATGAFSGLSTEVFDTTLAAGGVELTPDRSADVPVGGTVFHQHLLINGLARDEIFDLSYTTSLGSDVTFFPDPDRDGIPEDEAPILETPPVPAHGGIFPLVVRVTVPDLSVHAEVEATTVTATARTDAAVNDSVVDTASVQNLLTFSDPLFARPATSFFGVCMDVYAEGSGLATNADYRFLWNDPDTTNGPERNSGIREPDADGLVDDLYSLAGGDLTGQWTVRLQARSGSNWNNLPVGGARNFTVQAGGGVIAALTSGRAGYFIQGESVAVNARLENPTDVDFLGTVLRYVLFEDTDGDTFPTAGEPVIFQDGSSGGYAPGSFTHRTSPVDLLRGEEFRDFWRVTDVQFPTSGTWSLYLAWEMDCGAVIDELVSPVSVCASLPVADAGTSGPVCRGVPTLIGTPGQAGLRYRWFPSDDLDDASLAQPTVSLQQDRRYTLIVEEEATGCSNSDVLDLTVVENPTPDITPDAPIINVGGNVTLDSGVDVVSYAWSTAPPGEPGDGATTRTVDVAPTQDTLYTVTVTDANGCQATAQELVTVNPNPPEPQVQVSADTICLGEEITLDAGVATAEYLWATDPPGEPGDGATARTLMVTPTRDTTYTVTVTDGFGQQGADSAAVTVLTTTPGSLGASLRVRKTVPDVHLDWAAVPDGWSYTIYRSDRNDYASPSFLGEVPEPATSFTDPAAVDGVRLYLYQVHAKACFEGPR